MIKVSTSIFYVLFLSVVGALPVSASLASCAGGMAMAWQQQDTAKKTTTTVDTIGQMVKALVKISATKDTLNIRAQRNVPNVSLQQIIKGNLAGVYVQERTGEPGTEQSMIVQGTSGLFFQSKDMYALQPAIYLNGVALVADNAFAFDIQRYDFNRIGPANNLLSQINIDNIESIAVVKDPYELAKLGPNAVNGAIYITTKNASSGKRDISLNSYYGFGLSPTLNPTNGAYENNFRAQFYQKYNPNENVATYLKDVTNLAYFGPSDWSNYYYRNAPNFSADLGITGGSERANFRFFGSATQNAGTADETNLNKYNVFFGINMAPFKWLTVSSTVNANRLDRVRNRNLRDQFAEARYIPDLSTPLSPNSSYYSRYLDESSKIVDNNLSTILNGNLTLSAKFDKLTLTSSLLMDYNEGVRDYFIPSTLLDGDSFVSNYFGYSQRLSINNSADYKIDFGKNNHLKLNLGQNLQGDVYKYNYLRAYNGPNDFVKLVFVNGNASADNYLRSDNFYYFKYIDKEVNNLMSFYASAQYGFKDIVSLNALLRRDGSSNGQPDSRWVTTPAFSVNWNIKNNLLANNTLFSTLNMIVAWGRTLRIFQDDRFAAGPQYNSKSGWFEEPTIPGYGSRLTINRPYDAGFIGYGLSLPYADRTSVGFSGSTLNNRLGLSLDLYNREDKNGVIGLPVANETGYSINYHSGLNVNNKGVDLLINATPLVAKDFVWNSNINFNYNKNKLAHLPGDVQSVIFDANNKLEVGKSVGSYWLYKNNGIYNTEADVPAGRNFNGIPLSAGDPSFEDLNGDNRIDNKDKVLMSDRLPKFVGGWNNQFNYGSFELSFNLIFAAGQKALNQYDASRYGFVNREAGSDINSVREISSWQSYAKQKEYPIYNPWSAVDAYRVDQDLFLEDASYLKMRSATLGYDFAKMNKFKKFGIRRAFLYATALNVFTITKFSGTDPELINYNGVYDGSGLPLPRTFILGFKLDL